LVLRLVLVKGPLQTPTWFLSFQGFYFLRKRTNSCFGKGGLKNFREGMLSFGLTIGNLNTYKKVKPGPLRSPKVRI